jgi:hypothetical protein
MSTNYVRSDNIKILNLQLSSLDGSRVADISQFVLSFNIFEDILYPTVRANFLINDSIGLLNSFPIIGEELISIEFGQEGFDFTTEYTFHVKSIDNQRNTPQAKGKIYTLECISQEFIDNANKLINGKYEGQSEDVIRAIFENWFPNSFKSLTTGDPTKGVQKLLFSRLRPLMAIDLVRKRAVSQDYLSSSYVFFENKRGFNFCTIEYLMHQLQDNVKDKEFFIDTAQNTSNRNMNTRSIIHFQTVSQVNNTQKLTHGALHNTVKRFDLLTGLTTITKWLGVEKQDQFKFASDNPKALNTTQFEDKYNKDAAQALLVPHSSDLPENYIDSSLGARHAYITKLGQNIFQAFVYGDIALTAGDVITINVDNPTGSTSPGENNRLLAGNYLISRLRHIVVNGSGGAAKSYYVSMELIKGFYEDHG